MESTATTALQECVRWSVPLIANTSIVRRYVSLLKKCQSLDEGKQIHLEIIRSSLHNDRFICNYLVEMYGRHGDIHTASQVFRTIHDKNVYSWTIMIVACVQNGEKLLPLTLLKHMDVEGIKPDEMTYSSILGVFSGRKDYPQGKNLHERLQSYGYESNIVIATALINMYGSCGSISDVKLVYNNMQSKDVVSMSSMVAALAEFGLGEEAILLYHQMDLEGIKCNEITLVGVLVACFALGSLQVGREVHARVKSTGLSSNIFLQNSLVSMYGKCGCVREAEEIFHEMELKSTTSWNAMLAAYSQNGLSKETLAVHLRMDLEGAESDEFTYVAVLDACATSGTLHLGRQVHGRIISASLMNGFVSNALLDMYAKCGSLHEARGVFDDYCSGSVVSWTAMIAAYAQHGSSEEALELYSVMDLEGLPPNSVTFVNVLFACSHHGLVDRATGYFLSMQEDHELLPEVAHFGCMIDILSRAGQLDRAEEIFNSLPESVRGESEGPQLSLLGACQLHGDVVRGERVSLEVNTREKYVMLTNLYINTNTGRSLSQQLESRPS